MSRKKLLIVAGTRPELIKVAPLVRHLIQDGAIEVDLALTGQHAQMMQPLLEHFELKATRHLPINRVRGTLSELVGLVALGLDGLVADVRPDGILVHGDTTSAMVASLCGFSDCIPVFHLEAGLRSFDLSQPFPEEFNRRTISLAASLHFAPTEVSKDNLINDGVPTKNVHIVGNTVIDALFWTLRKSESSTPIFRPNTSRVLVTCHRRESWDTELQIVCESLKTLTHKLDKIHVVFPVHPNPIVRGIVESALKGVDNITLCAPLDYPVFCKAMGEADLIITDSGGIQEEALALGKPTLVTRWKTERPEVLQWETVRLVGSDSEAILRESMRLLQDKEYYARCSVVGLPFGKGESCQLIASHLKDYWNE